jgi:hypothetical protein
LPPASQIDLCLHDSRPGVAIEAEAELLADALYGAVGRQLLEGDPAPDASAGVAPYRCEDGGGRLGVSRVWGVAALAATISLSSVPPAFEFPPDGQSGTPVRV